MSCQLKSESFLNFLGVLARYNEKMGRMVSGFDSTYEELFAYACPKFITAAPPNLDAPGSNTNQVQSQPCCPLKFQHPCTLMHPALHGLMSGAHFSAKGTTAHSTVLLG